MSTELRKIQLKKNYEQKMSTIEITIIKSVHVLMKNAFTSGKKKKRTALRCVSKRIVSQSRACGIYYHHGNGKLDI